MREALGSAFFVFDRWRVGILFPSFSPPSLDSEEIRGREEKICISLSL
jgi:hypothetical protein